MGSCPFLCENVFYIKVQRNLDRICNQLNRTGQLCGRCSEGYAPAVYSYGSQCVKCTHYKHNWIKYLVIAYLPVTLFYVFVVMFKFNAMSLSMIAYIFVCQIVSSPAFSRILTTFMDFSEKQPVIHLNLRLIGEFVSSLYGLWNLDFFCYTILPSSQHVYSSNDFLRLCHSYISPATYFLDVCTCYNSQSILSSPAALEANNIYNGQS